MSNVFQQYVDEAIGGQLVAAIDKSHDEGMRESLRMIARTRFGAVPPALEARITAAHAEALQTLLVRAAAAGHVEGI